MTRQHKAERPIHCVLDADTDSDERARSSATIIAYLERGFCAGEIEAVMPGSRYPQGLAQAAGAGREQPVRRISGKAAICSHEADSIDWFEGTQQDAAGETFHFATDVHAEVLAVN